MTVPQFFRDHMRRPMEVPVREMQEATDQALPPPTVPNAREKVLSGRWLNPGQTSSLPWRLSSKPAWSVAWKQRLTIGGKLKGIQLTRNRALAHSSDAWELLRARDGKHITSRRLGPSDVFIHPDGRSFFYEDLPPEALICRSLRTGAELFATTLSLAGDLQRTHFSILPDGRFVAAGSAPPMSAQGRPGTIAGLVTWSFGDRPRTNEIGLLSTGKRCQVLNHDSHSFHAVRSRDGFVIAVNGAIAFANPDLELSSLITTEPTEPLWLSVDLADRIHLVLREESGDFAYWLLSPTGARCARTGWPSSEGSTMAPPIVGQDLQIYLVFSQHVVCLGTWGERAWTVEVPEPIGGAAVSADGSLLVSAGHDVMTCRTENDIVRTTTLATLEGTPLSTAPVLAPSGRMLVASQSHLYALQSRRA
ncbi:MAG: hypothetical protein ACI8QZ_003375 [Chlamydiales bacterium]